MTREEAIKFAEYAQIMADGKPDVQEFYKIAEAALREQDSNANQHVSNTPNALGGWISVEERLPGVQFTRCAECRYSRELNRDDPVERKFVEGCVWCTERSDGMFRSGGCSEGLPGEAT